MQLEIYKDPFPHIIVNSFFWPAEQELLWRETEFLFRKLKGPRDTKAAVDINGNYKKSGKGLFVDDVYTDRGYSDILELTLKLFREPEFKEAAKELGGYFDLWGKVDWHSTLLQYYDIGDHYSNHYDSSLFTCVHTFFQTPKQFYGGDLEFTQHDMVMPITNNQSIIFPSIVEHKVTPVQATSLQPLGGRFSLSNLLLWNYDK